MIARLPPRRRTAAWHIRFGVGVDVAESTTEAHVDSSEPSLVVLVSVIDNASLRTGSYCGRDALPASVGAIDPHRHSLHHKGYARGFRKAFCAPCYSTERSRREPTAGGVSDPVAG